MTRVYDCYECFDTGIVEWHENEYVRGVSFKVQKREHCTCPRGFQLWRDDERKERSRIEKWREKQIIDDQIERDELP